MSHLNVFAKPVTVCCPNCGHEFEIDEMPISVTVDGYDICGTVGEGKSNHLCGACNLNITVDNQVHIWVDEA